jgi:hypothetical protein
MVYITEEEKLEGLAPKSVHGNISDLISPPPILDQGLARHVGRSSKTSGKAVVSVVNV